MMDRGENALLSGHNERNPPQVTEDFWISVYRQRPDDPCRRDGTWVIHALRPHIDYLWHIVMLATEEGYLGSSSIASAAAFPLTAQTTTHVICVFTDDRNNREEAMHIRGGLRELLLRDDGVLRDISEWEGDFFGPECAKLTQPAK